MDPTVTTSADGVVTITAQVELDLPEPDEPEDAPQPDGPNEATEALKGAGRAVGRVLWGLIKPKPDDSPPAEPEEE